MLVLYASMLAVIISVLALSIMELTNSLINTCKPWWAIFTSLQNQCSLIVAIMNTGMLSKLNARMEGLTKIRDTDKATQSLSETQRLKKVEYMQKEQ